MRAYAVANGKEECNVGMMTRRIDRVLQGRTRIRAERILPVALLAMDGEKRVARQKNARRR